MENNINLFFIGDRFYRESGSMMSPIYIKETKERYDWGFVNVALKNGYTVTIKPATEDEILWAENQLKEYKEHNHE